DAEIMHVFQEGRLKSFRRPELSSARNVAVCAAAAKGGREIVAPALRVQDGFLSPALGQQG
ncbi:MAG: hypothetical protein KA993_05335, partial [Neisseria sp.]|nr:hypothetical protein [Neisseria sp.]